MFISKEQLIQILHEEYKTSCAKRDIEALKSTVTELTKRLQKLENPPKKLTKKEQKIKDLQDKIELETQRCSYVNKQGTRIYQEQETDVLIEMKYELLQLTKGNKK